MDSAQLLRHLTEALQKREEEVPAGYRTVHQLCKDWGFSSAHTFRLIQKGLEIGLIEQRKFRIKNGKRGVYPVWHYIAKSEATKSKATRSSRTRK